MKYRSRTPNRDRFLTSATIHDFDIDTAAAGGAKSHTLLIGFTSAPIIAATSGGVAEVAISVANSVAVADTIADTIDGTGTLTYDLGLSCYNDSITKTVPAGTGSVALTEGYANNRYSAAYFYGIGVGSGNAVTNLLTTGGNGTVTVKQYVNGGSKTLYNNVTTTSVGAICPTQGGTASTGILATNNLTNNYASVASGD